MSLSNRITSWAYALWHRLTGIELPLPPQDGTQLKEKK